MKEKFEDWAFVYMKFVDLLHHGLTPEQTFIDISYYCFHEDIELSNHTLHELLHAAMIEVYYH
ncbi:hypothetical protein [Halorhodospira sp. 9628]|uniref:hypothetical protein n=1 Tax=Halorhodospira sp. 9628 TaxID=2899137 RepID=UPI001EE8C401|nr:hypothetical protein [Halorhodospira sp. 9628]MCG5528627.1 hypothetical protein [Halorhodospira halophila]MCG5543954.1 hypothetical protein [Halorhodospira sp. 9628]